jgi:ABC-type uncharacterized transport system auxiliary subunit
VRARLKRSLASICASLCAAGCALTSPVSVPVHQALLDQVPAAPPAAAPRPATVVVLPPQASAAYDTTRVAYSPAPHQVAYFRDQEWAATPSQMLHGLLTTTLQATHAFAAVLAPPHAGPAYVLRTQLVELLQDQGSVPAVARVALHVQLAGPAALRPSWSEEVVVREPIAGPTPLAGLAAVNAATAEALRRVAAFVLDKTAPD